MNRNSTILRNNLISEEKKRYKLIVLIKSLCNVTVPDPYLIIHPIAGGFDSAMAKLGLSLPTLEAMFVPLSL